MPDPQKGPTSESISGPTVEAFYDDDTATCTYVVYDPTTLKAALIDPVLNFDQAASKTSTRSCDVVSEFIQQKKLQLIYILETHAHADHLSGAQEIKRRFPSTKLGISDHITDIQRTWCKLFHLGEQFPVHGEQFDFLFKDGQRLELGALKIQILYTPGHTPACTSFLIGDAVFTGDALCMPDTGTGRCDFPNGSAAALFDSISKRLYCLPDQTRVFVGHDYKGGGKREARWQTSIQESKLHNIHINSGTTRESYIKFRTERDKTLSAPRLLLPSLFVNINAGLLPEPEANGQRYLKIPIQ